jgi:hypothetical protein
MGHLPPSDQITRDSPQTLPNQDHWSKDDHVNSDVPVSDYSEALCINPSWPQSIPVDDLSMIDPAHQFPGVQNVWAEETLPQSSINTPLNIPEASIHPAIASPSHNIWPPQQTFTIPTPQTFTGFSNPSLMPYPNMSYPTPSLMPPPLLTPTLPIPTTTPRTPCPLCTESFARHSDLNRHWQSVHLGIKYHCDYWLGCPNNGGKGYCRLEKLRTHQREKHGFAWS